MRHQLQQLWSVSHLAIHAFHSIVLFILDNPVEAMTCPSTIYLDRFMLASPVLTDLKIAVRQKMQSPNKGRSHYQCHIARNRVL
jgi:hypothetical protein